MKRYRIGQFAFYLCLCLLWSAATVAAQPPAGGMRTSMEAGAVHQWKSNVDGGGDLSIDTWSARGSLSTAVSPTLRLGLTAGVGERRYDFSADPGQSGFASLEPWSNIRSARLSGSLFWRPNDRWDVFAIPTLRWNAESGASMSDGQIGGLITAASYKLNDRLSIGPGFGVFSELEDDTDWFPILAIDWRITDDLSLSTGRGFAASRGPGLTLNWRPSDRWAVALGGRYEKERFRLDDRGPASGGIGQETSIPIYMAVTRKLGRAVQLSAVAGVELNGSLRLEDGDGRLLERADYDTAPFAGATLDLRF